MAGAVLHATSDALYVSTQWLHREHSNYTRSESLCEQLCYLVVYSLLIIRSILRTYRYMRSNTKALWPMLIEKAWIKLLGGAGYDDICPD
eukprot:COSAG06_NODE_61045_length_269_cov_0.582353_1_plen_89_part_11